MEAESELARAQKRTDAASYDAVARSFDGMSERFSAAIADAVLHRAEIGLGDRVLDLGSGAGLLTVRAAKLAARGSVVGIDHSEGMLRQAREKAQAQGVSDRVALQQMDAEALTFEAGAFDAAVSLFVLAHLPNPDVALRELHRVLKPGGRLVVGVGAPAPLLSKEGVGRAMLRLRHMSMAAQERLATAPRFMQQVLADLGHPPGEADHVHAALDVPALLEAAGFSRSESSWVGSTFELTAEEFWDVCAVYGSNERVRLSALSEAARAALKDEFMARAGAIVERGGKLIYQCGAAIYYSAAI